MAPPPLPAPPPTLAASIAAATPTVPPTDEGHDGSAVPDEAPDPLLLVAHTHRSVYAADQQNDIWFALSVKVCAGIKLVYIHHTPHQLC